MACLLSLSLAPPWTHEYPGANGTAEGAIWTWALFLFTSFLLPPQTLQVPSPEAIFISDALFLNAASGNEAYLRNQVGVGE